MNKPSYIGHRERIKNKFKKEGLKPFLDHEALELLLTYSIPRKDTKKLAWNLIKSFGSLNAVLNADSLELQKIQGLGPQSSILINVVREIINRYSCYDIDFKKNILNQAELYKYCLEHLENRDQEFFEVLLLDIKTNLIASEVIAEGHIDTNAISVRKIIELVLKYGAKFVICVHNDPSGNLVPYEEDHKITENLNLVLQVISARLIDRIIIGTDRIYSFSTNAYTLISTV